MMKPMQRVLVVLLLVGVTVGGYVLLRKQKSAPQQATKDLPRVAELALAYTESLDAAKAIPLWEQVQQAHPDNPDILQNVAINHYLDYASRVQLILGDTLSDQERQQMRQSMTAAYATCEEDLMALKEKAPDRLVLVWLNHQLPYQRSRLLPAAMASSTQAELTDSLAKVILERPEPELLGLMFEYSEQSDPTATNDAFDKALAKVSQVHSGNLCIGAEFAKRQIMRHDEAVLTQLKQLASLCEPMAEEMQRQFGQPLDAFVDKLNDAIEKKDWNTSESLLQSWINVMTATQAWRTDQHRLHPHALDFVVLKPIYDLVQSQSADDNLTQWEASAFGDTVWEMPNDPQAKVRKVIFADVDLDEHDEWVVLSPGQLKVYKYRDGVFDDYASIHCAEDADQVVWADLFMVDSGAPERLKASRSGLSQEALQELANHHDTFVSLVVSGPGGVEIFRVVPAADSSETRLVPPTKPTGLEAIRGVTAITRGDVEADGDLDLLLGTEQGLEIWINRGNMTFYPVAKHSQLPSAQSPIRDLVVGDLDRDLDLDCVTLQADGTVGMLENLLHQQFRWRELKELKAYQGTKLEVVDLDGDVSWDILVQGPEKLAVTKTSTPATGRWIIQSVESYEIKGADFDLADLDYDGWLDLMTGDASGIKVHRGKAPGGFTARPEYKFDKPASEVQVADMDRDGLQDIMYLSRDGTAGCLPNRIASPGHSLAVRYRGIDDNATGRVNHYAIGSTVELWSGNRYQSAIIQERTTKFGLGADREPQTLRAVLTNGVTQHVIKPPVDTVLNEIQVLKGSCPYLYAWNGTEMAFVTDCLWGAPLGLQFAPGKVLPDRPWEYLLVPGQAVQPHDGFYELSITEELWEVTYLDHVSLTAIDHPIGTQIFTNEKVGPPNIASERLYTFSKLLSADSVHDLQGNDCGDDLHAIDGKYARDFERRIRQGIADPHGLEIEFKAWEKGDKVLLVLTGWVMPTDTSLNIQYDQNPELGGVVPPSIWIPDGDDWKQAVPFMGFPGGKTKTIVVDVSELLISNDPRIQVRTSGEFYWDAVAFVVNPPDLEVKEQLAPLADAELVWHGFGNLIPRSSREPQRYLYNERKTDMLWPPLAGGFTRFGKVSDQLKAWDDRMIVMGPGDEVKLQFKIPEHETPKGWTRDFILHNVGWDKDADLNTFAGQASEPLPFKSMSAYPPPERDRELIQLSKSLNESQLTRSLHFRNFWKRSWQSDSHGVEPHRPNGAFVDRAMQSF